MSRKEIARRLGISPNTVANHIQSAYAKLGAADIIDALRALGRITTSGETP